MRKARIKAPGVYYHVTSNFHLALLENIKGWVKRRLIRFVRQAKQKFHFKIKNLCVMNTHFHLLIKPGRDEDISIIMKFIKQKFSQWFNRIFGSSGSVWRERFFSRIINDVEDLTCVFIYIQDNPIKAGLVLNSLDYPFYEIWDTKFTL